MSRPSSDDKAAALAAAKEKRQLLIERLDRDDEEDLADILRGCGQPLHLTCTCCGAMHQAESRCKKRWCPVCARQISAKRVSKYVGAVEAMQWPLFLTLTRPNLKHLTLADIKHLRRGYRRLRQQAWWGRAVKGGIASLEITNTGKGWHPHIHSIIDCRWLSVTVPPPKALAGRDHIVRVLRAAAKEVAARWAGALELPRASIHIKRAYTPRTTPEMPYGSSSIAVEVLKYSVKPDDLIDCTEPVGDLIRLMGAARMVSSFGSCYGQDLDGSDKPKPPPLCSCGAAGSLVPQEVVNIWARQAADAVRRGRR